VIAGANPVTTFTRYGDVLCAVPPFLDRWYPRAQRGGPRSQLAWQPGTSAHA
jgi:hypothetical protein